MTKFNEIERITDAYENGEKLHHAEIDELLSYALNSEAISSSEFDILKVYDTDVTEIVENDSLEMTIEEVFIDLKDKIYYPKRNKI